MTVTAITERMEQIGMTRADLVRAADMSRTQVDRYLSGAVVPSATVWLRLVDAVGMKVDLSPSDEWAGVEFADKVARRAQVLEMQASSGVRSHIILDNFMEIKSGQR